MLKNAFAGQAERPTEKQLAAALGTADLLWKSLITDLRRDLNLDAEEWNSTSIKAGWSLRLQLKKRNIVYLAPSTGSFLASFALGDKAVAEARRRRELPASVHKIIDQAKRYAEGTAVRVEVHTAQDANVVKTLAKIKTEN
jgi:hypothetical protein